EHAVGNGEHTRPRVFRPAPRRSERKCNSLTSKCWLVRAPQCGWRGRQPLHARRVRSPFQVNSYRFAFGRNLNSLLDSLVPFVFFPHKATKIMKKAIWTFPLPKPKYLVC